MSTETTNKILPAGYYAVNGKRYHLSVPTKGKWKGFQFLATGSDYHSRKRVATVLPNGKFSYGTQQPGVFMQISADPLEAMREYGRITGTCGKCGRKLEDPDSIAAGIGPVCAAKMAE